jgi:hypothetical protein
MASTGKLLGRTCTRHGSDPSTVWIWTETLAVTASPMDATTMLTRWRENIETYRSLTAPVPAVRSTVPVSNFGWLTKREPSATSDHTE